MNPRGQNMARLPGVVAHFLRRDGVGRQGANHSRGEVTAGGRATILQPAHVTCQPDRVKGMVLKVDEQHIRPRLGIGQAGCIGQVVRMRFVDRLPGGQQFDTLVDSCHLRSPFAIVGKVDLT